ncbi:MAG: phage terminase large subunit, partial [Clostridia bacterium]|nr:phage terminase large subunit [Clostridia bacterium]
MTWALGSPNDKQSEFLRATARYVAYGGARGGGKSWAVRKKAILLALNYGGIKLLILRRTFTELQENHILPLQAELSGIAIYREKDKSFTFPNGSRIKFGYCDSESDVLQYQGQEYDIVFIDEATHFTEFQYNALTAIVRGANSFPKRMYLTCNPGGVGHAWVKRLFIDREYKPSERAQDYVFIKATVYDNHVLLENDPDYVHMLENLPEDLRQAWLYGSWDVFAGQYFTEWSESIHVIAPFDIPSHWRRYVSLDYGLDMLAAYCIAIDERGRAYVYRETYESGLIISDAAQAIKRMTGSDTIYQYFAPPDMWNKRQETGKSVAEIFGEHGIYLTKAQNDRVAGWLDMHEWLKVYSDEQDISMAGLRVMRGCTNLIRCIPLLQ